MNYVLSIVLGAEGIDQLYFALQWLESNPQLSL